MFLLTKLLYFFIYLVYFIPVNDDAFFTENNVASGEYIADYFLEIGALRVTVLVKGLRRKF